MTHQCYIIKFMDAIMPLVANSGLEKSEILYSLDSGHPDYLLLLILLCILFSELLLFRPIC